MLELDCIFCGEHMLVMRHVDTEVWQVVCVSCGGRGPYGKCNHEAKEKYIRAARIDSRRTLDSGE